MLTPNILLQKALRFFENRKWGRLEAVRKFCKRGGGVNFLRFWANVFYGQPLGTVRSFILF